MLALTLTLVGLMTFPSVEASLSEVTLVGATFKAPKGKREASCTPGCSSLAALEVGKAVKGGFKEVHSAAMNCVTSDQFKAAKCSLTVDLGVTSKIADSTNACIGDDGASWREPDLGCAYTMSGLTWPKTAATSKNKVDYSSSDGVKTSMLTKTIPKNGAGLTNPCEADTWAVNSSDAPAVIVASNYINEDATGDIKITWPKPIESGQQIWLPATSDLKINSFDGDAPWSANYIISRTYAADSDSVCDYTKEKPKVPEPHTETTAAAKGVNGVAHATPLQLTVAITVGAIAAALNH